VNRKAKKVSTIPGHREIYGNLCRKICKDLGGKRTLEFLTGSDSYNYMGSFRFPKLQRTAFTVASALEPSDEKSYWLAKTPSERLAAVELMRQIIYGYDPSTTRLQRVLEVAQRSHQDLADLENLP
jgi:hypothetical protein